MDFLYRIQPTPPEMLVDDGTPEEQRIVGEHFAHLQRLTAEGVVVLAGRTLTVGEEGFGIIVFRADDEASARTLMESDPAVAGGVMSAELFPFSLALLGT